LVLFFRKKHLPECFSIFVFPLFEKRRGQI
jgi:hypothetical protein